MTIDVAGAALDVPLQIAPVPATTRWPQAVRWQVTHPELATIDSLGRLRVLQPGDVEVRVELVADPTIQLTRRLRLRRAGGPALGNGVLQTATGEAVTAAPVQGRLLLDPTRLGAAPVAGSRLQVVEVLPEGRGRTWLDQPVPTNGTPLTWATDAVDPATRQPLMRNGTYTVVVRLVPPTPAGSPAIGPDQPTAGTRESAPVRLTVDNPNRLWVELLDAPGTRTARDAQGQVWQAGDIRMRVGLILHDPNRVLPSGTRLRMGTPLTLGGMRAKSLPWMPQDPATFDLVFAAADSAATGSGGYEFQPGRYRRLRDCGGTEPMPSGVGAEICDVLTRGELPSLVLPPGATGWSPTLLGPDLQPMNAPQRQGVRIDNRGPAPVDPAQRFRLTASESGLPGFPQSSAGWVRGTTDLTRSQREGGPVGEAHDEGIDAGRTMVPTLEQRPAGATTWSALRLGSDLGSDGTRQVEARLRMIDALGNVSYWPITDGQDGRPQELGRSDGRPALVRRGGLSSGTIHKGSAASLPPLQLDVSPGASAAPPLTQHAWVRLWTWNAERQRVCATSVPGVCGWSLRAITNGEVAVLPSTAADGRYDAEVIGASQSGVASADTIRLQVFVDGTNPQIGPLSYQASRQVMTVAAADGGGVRTVWGGMTFNSPSLTFTLWGASTGATGNSPLATAPQLQFTAVMDFSATAMGGAPGMPVRVESTDGTGLPRGVAHRAILSQLRAQALDWADRIATQQQAFAPGGATGPDAGTRGLSRALMERTGTGGPETWTTNTVVVRTVGSAAAQPQAIYWLGRRALQGGGVEHVLLATSTARTAITSTEHLWRAPTTVRPLGPWAGETMQIQALLVWSDGESLLTQPLPTGMPIR